MAECNLNRDKLVEITPIEPELSGIFAVPR